MARSSKATLVLLIYGIIMHFSVYCTPIGLTYPKIRYVYGHIFSLCKTLEIWNEYLLFILLLLFSETSKSAEITLGSLEQRLYLTKPTQLKLKYPTVVLLHKKDHNKLFFYVILWVKSRSIYRCIWYKGVISLYLLNQAQEAQFSCAAHRKADLSMEL